MTNDELTYAVRLMLAMTTLYESHVGATQV